ncbi:MAG TPA: single-stranded-DNA-specific exonuclease RecJ [Ignavibacteria bacterium]|nr:single-stranded-DNA-specific exonuclease RecJ [Ignavibacteria bacterium]
MMKKRWIIKKVDDEYSVNVLSDSLKISEILARVLILRNIKTFHDAKNYFRPTLANLHDPFLMDGMETATYRVIKALTENQLITVYGDYDVDGTCSTALLYLFLKELGANVDYYIPQRLSEGYGLSKTGFDNINKNGTSLVITVDCGITAVEETDYANSLGMDIIICDHHLPKDKLPDACAVLDPIKPNCEYPFKYLSGAGVAFKLAQGVSERIGKKDLPFKFLDLVALAAAADIVQLTGENRILVRAGIEIINNNPRPGIKALIKSSRITPGNLSSGQIVFTIAPRINAAGRMGDAKRAVDLFVADDFETAKEYASVLENENYERRKIDETTLNDALKLVENELDLNVDIPIVLHQEQWHAGVIGIVASRLVEKYYRPTIMLTTIDGVAKGSARSISDFNIYNALEKCENVLLQFGGHKAAAGLELEIDKINEFKEQFNKVVKESLSEDKLYPEINIDSKLKFSEITPKFLRILDQFTPFGPKNMRPIFLSEKVQTAIPPRIVGKNHLLVSFKQEGATRVFDAIGFSLSDRFDIVNNNQNFIDIVFTIDKTTRNGNTFPQLRIKDLKISNS